MAQASLAWQWQPCPNPPAPRAAVAWGEAAARLHARLLQMPAAQRRRLEATAASQVLIVSGDSADLPWVDGVEYAAPAPQAAGLWLPTRWQPQVAADLLLQGLQARFPRLPLLLWPAPTRVIALDRMLSLALPEHLALIAQRWGHDATA
ncbi:bpX5 domain-containing protein [Pseudomonas putida]